ncbi:hypothetical protein [uncultured Vibrio sp.]|uniref:hypothetical protein n=1 Tax=uncultured Vibrio sp. TaxID=114054 RepID=UPI002635F5FE|nr:hypothetical protein [uncultured Vibrio sp.]
MLFLLSFGLVNANGYSFLAKPFQIHAAQASSTHSDLCHQMDTDDASVYLECDKASLSAERSDDSFRYHDPELSLQATGCRRIFSNEQKSAADLEPVYHLLIDLSPPSLLASLLVNTPMLDAKQHWTSIVSSPSSRLSGWKEGNIQYSHFRELLS